MASPTWQEHRIAGNAAYTSGDTPAAVDAYTAALRCDDLPAGDRATILGNRAQCFLKLNLNAKAVEDCTAALTLAPDNVKSLFRRAAALEALGELRDALRDYQDVLKVNPAVADAATGARRLEAALGIVAAPVPEARAAKQLSRDDVRALQECEDRWRDVKKQRAKTAAQASAAVREQRSLELTLGQLAGLGDGSRTYQAVGKMFLLTPTPDLVATLTEKQARAKQKVHVCEGAIDYLTRQEKEAEGALTELMRGLGVRRVASG